jgi:hypothetical protein
MNFALADAVLGLARSATSRAVPALPLAERFERSAEIVLGHGPLERDPLAGSFLQGFAKGGNGLYEPRLSENRSLVMVRKSEFGHAGQIAPRDRRQFATAAAQRKVSLSAEARSACFLKPACCLRNCDRGKKSSFSTVSVDSGHSVAFRAEARL